MYDFKVPVPNFTMYSGVRIWESKRFKIPYLFVKIFSAACNVCALAMNARYVIYMQFVQRSASNWW